MATRIDDFRERFHLKADESIMNAEELAQLLCTTVGAIRQMVRRKELPPTAFPGKRRAVWFVGVIRAFLGETQTQRNFEPEQKQQPAKRVGRPRLSTDVAPAHFSGFGSKKTS
ncbi:hypothetical protein ACI2VA_08685 [Ralstonia nicotianae]